MPSSVRAAPRTERRSRARPTRRSRSFIAADIVGWETWSRSAAAVIEPSAATSTK